jgi:thymidylate synthase (FAD)
MPTYPEALRIIESAARTCYKSEDKIGPGSAEKLIRHCIKRGHESVLEHVGFALKIVCDRGVMDELTRHRIGVAFSVESTRYVRYDGDMAFVEPWWWDDRDEFDRASVWRQFESAEDTYDDMLEHDFPPQAARAVLPLALATTITMTANIREWRHIFKLRCDKAAHPDMVRVMTMARDIARGYLPVFFEDLA